MIEQNRNIDYYFIQCYIGYILGIPAFSVSVVINYDMITIEFGISKPENHYFYEIKINMALSHNTIYINKNGSQVFEENFTKLSNDNLLKFLKRIENIFESKNL